MTGLSPFYPKHLSDVPCPYAGDVACPYAGAKSCRLAGGTRLVDPSSQGETDYGR